jgi:4'-phosphopantetheinyl transferase
MTPEILFGPPPASLELVNGEVHVFCAALDLSPARRERLARSLSDDERERAARFHFERDRNRFVAGRGMLREILGRLLGMTPEELFFSYGVHGKPRLAAPTGADFHFNVAHSDSLAVYAVARRQEVGIDVERIRPLPEMEHLAEQLFSEPERARWRRLPDDQKMAAFYHGWVRKEALLKAGGQGLGGPPDRAGIFSGGDLSGTAQYALRTLTPALDYTAALATECRDARVNCWNWPEESLNPAPAAPGSR